MNYNHDNQDNQDNQNTPTEKAIDIVEKTLVEIEDGRSIKEFSRITLSNYKKAEVKKRLIESLTQHKLENANYWTAEYICAGHFLELWEIIIMYMSKYVHIGNPRLPVYIIMRLEDFRAIVSNGYRDNELEMRNDARIRMLFCEIFSLMCFSQRKHCYSTIKIPKKEFQITELSYKLKADNLKYAEEIWQKDDPKECFIAINEFMYALHNGETLEMEACYWYEWALDYEQILKKKHDKCVCARRSFALVEPKLQNEIVWLFWEGILNYSIEKGPFYEKIVDALFNLYCLRFSQGSKRKRRFVLYFAINILCAPINVAMPISQNARGLEQIKAKLNDIYKQIKKNEVRPNTDYLYHGLNKNALKETQRKLEMMNQLSFPTMNPMETPNDDNHHTNTNSNEIIHEDNTHKNIIIDDV